MIYEIFHWTEYRYAEPVPLSKHVLHLLPRDIPGQRVLSSSLELTPQPQAVLEHSDYFGNRVSSFTITEPHLGMHIRSRCHIDCDIRPEKPPKTSPPWEEARSRWLAGEGDRLEQEFLYPSPYAPYLNELRAWAAESFPAGRPLAEAALELTGRIHDDFVFDKTATSVSTPLTEVFKNRRGVCQDFAHLEIACLRAIGVPARYVSGYLRTEPSPGQPRLFGADASHAWVALACPGFGWLELDPTNNRVAGSGYITLAWGRDYGDVSLIRGTLAGGGDHSLYLSVNVEAVEPTPEPT
jgi:transglutaminase-like putative cysteine protease